MSSSNLRVLGSNISRMLLPASPMVASSSLKLVPVAAKAQLSAIRRDLHNVPKTANQQMATSSVAPPQEQYVPLAAESIFKVDEVKVFQDEQIIQLAFKSGEKVNYTMSWLRNLCSCPNCISNKFHTSLTQGSMGATSLVDGELSVARFSSNEDELLIEWLDTEYKSHISTYNLKYLNLYANSQRN